MKKDIDEIVDRIIEGKEEFQRIGLDSLFNHLKTTESVTQIPKALKFLRPHYEKLTSYYPKMMKGDYKVSLFFLSFFQGFDITVSLPFCIEF